MGRRRRREGKKVKIITWAGVELKKWKKVVPNHLDGCELEKNIFDATENLPKLGGESEGEREDQKWPKGRFSEKLPSSVLSL